MKNVVITGSTRGIGLAMATVFLRAGCNVTLSGRQFSKLGAAYRHCGDNGMVVGYLAVIGHLTHVDG